MATDELLKEGEEVGKKDATEKVRNLPPPDMIQNSDGLEIYKKRLRRWSRLSTLNPQTQFDLVLNALDVSHPLCSKLEEEIGDSDEAATKGIEVLLSKLDEIYGREEEIDAFKNYKEFEEKVRKEGQDLVEYINEWETLYNKLKSKGDTLSDRILAFKLIVSCNLDETEHKLVFREAKSKENDGQVYENTKKAIKMFYNAGTLKTIKESKILTFDGNEEKISDALANTLTAQGWKAPKTRNHEPNPPYTKWFKCKHCRCKCTPPFKRCECPCSKHKSRDCPTNTKERNESDAPNKQYLAEILDVKTVLIAFSADNAKETFSADMKEKDLCRILKKTPQEKSVTYGSLAGDPAQTPVASDSNKNHEPVDEEPSVERQAVHEPQDTQCIPINLTEDIQWIYFNEDSRQVSKEQRGAKVIIDSGATSTIAGVEWTKDYFKNLPEAIKASISIEKSDQKFQFGGGEVRKSLGLVVIPAYVLDDEYQAHLLMIKIDVVEANIPLLFGARSLDKAEASMKFGENSYLASEKVFGAGTRIPLRRDGGHYVFAIFPPTDDDNKRASSATLNLDNCSAKKASSTISYITTEENPTYEAILDEKILFSKRYKKHAGNDQGLTRKDIIKLHHFFGHCTTQRLEKLIQKAGKWKPEHSEVLEEISKCQVCAVEAKRKSLPKTAIPRASNFNQLITLDLKYNTKYAEKSSPYILYIIDAFTRYKAAVFLNDKSATSVVEALLIHWIRIFGRPSIVHFDRGSEFVNQEMQALCHKYDIKMWTL